MNSGSRSGSEPPLKERVENGGEGSHCEGSPSDKATAPAGLTLKQKAHSLETTSDGKQARILVTDAVDRKRTAEDEPDSTPPKKILLQDHIPESCVIDYQARDRRTVKLTHFVSGVTPEDVNDLCEDAVGIEHKFNKARKLLCSFAWYESEQKAVEASKTLQNGALRDCPFFAFYCGERWRQWGSYPKVLYDTLDLHGVPKEFRDKEKLAAIFPTGEILDVPDYGVVQLKFSSPDELLEAVKDPECRTIGGQNIQFALAVIYKCESEPKIESKQEGENEQDVDDELKTEHEEDDTEEGCFVS